MLLNELIAELESLPADFVMSPGLTHPHTYEGRRDGLAFEPGPDAPADQVLHTVRSTLGQIFECSVSGGGQRIHPLIPVWLATRGEPGYPIVGVTDTMILGMAA